MYQYKLQFPMTETQSQTVIGSHITQSKSSLISNAVARYADLGQSY